MDPRVLAVPVVYYLGSPLVGAGQPEVVETLAAGLAAPLAGVFAVGAGQLEAVGDGAKFMPPAASAATSYLMSGNAARAALGAAATYAIYPETTQPSPSCSIQ